METYLFKTTVPPCNPAPPAKYLDDWIETVSLKDMAKRNYDVLIVGSGIGGGAALWRLCDKWRNTGKKIGIVEAGGLLLPTHAQNIPTFNMPRFNRFFLNPKISTQFMFPEFPGATMVYALGGRTLFWTAVTPRMYPGEFASWPISYEELVPYYNIAEKVMNVSSFYTRGSTLTQTLLNRLRQNGFPDAIDAPVAADLQTSQYGEVHPNTFFSSICFIGNSLNIRPFDLAINARVSEVMVDGKKAVGVRILSKEKKPYFIRAKNIVLSASTFDTPRILLNSRIYGRAIGHYLYNHSFVTTIGTVKTKDFPEIFGTLAIVVPQSAERPYQIQLKGPENYYWYHNEVKPFKEEWNIIFQGFGSVEPRFENQVYLVPNERDQYGIPKIQVQFSYSEKDQYIIQQMTQAIQQTALAMGVPFSSEAVATEYGIIGANQDQPLICLMPPGLDYHEAGTCRMGYDPNTSATNRYGQVHGVPGLYVADKSVLPTTGAPNPTLTTAALAIRTADYIVEKSK